MTWLDWVNACVGSVSLGSGSVELMNWAHSARFPDNRPHRHTFFEICMVGAYGEGKFIVEGVPYRVRPGDLFVARPGIDHQIVVSGGTPMELYWLCFQWPGEKLPGDDDPIHRLMQSFAESRILVTGAGAVASIWNTIRALLDGPVTLGYENQVRDLSSALIIGIAQRSSEAGVEAVQLAGSYSADAAARHAVRFIQDNLHHPLSVGDVAAEVHVSPRHLHRILIALTGLSPARYIANARLEHARHLLANSQRPIKEVGTAVGYSDVHHFTRAYTAHCGVTPGETRRKAR